MANRKELEVGTAVSLIEAIYGYEIGAMGVIAPSRGQPASTVLVQFDETDHLVTVDAAALSVVN